MKRDLFFRTDGTFKIMQLTDLHYTYDNEADEKTVALTRALIEAERPDLLMLTGDIVYGERNMELLPKVMAPIIASGIPFSFVFGNHDVEFAGSRRELFDAILRLPGCVSYDDPEAMDGVGNHTIAVRDRKGRARWLILGLDSGDYNRLPGVGGYGYLSSRQIEWYRSQIRRQAVEDPQFSAMIYMHMALPEFREMWDYEPCYGVKREGIGCPHINSGMFAAMLEEGHAKGLFVGHDHINDFWGYYYGIALGYGRVGGYSAYAAEDYLRGARLFSLREDDLEHFETWVRLENGNLIRDPWKYTPLKKRDEG